MIRYFISEKCFEIRLVSGDTFEEQIFVTEDVFANLGLLAFVVLK